MSKLRTAGALTQGPDARLCRLQPIIDLDVAPLIQFDTSILEPYAPCVRGASGRDKDVGGVNRALPALVTNLYSDAFLARKGPFPASLQLSNRQPLCRDEVRFAGDY